MRAAWRDNAAVVGSQLSDRAYGFNNGYGASKENRETVRAVVVGVDLGFAAFFAASAIYGYVAVSSCLPKKRDERLLLRLAGSRPARGRGG